MPYETFLFTRNRRRDFTAFIRPKEMTNKEVSLIASALNYITDVSALTRAWPSFYCFPLGAYTLLLRHYDSGRKHAGREIGVIEGAAVNRQYAADFARTLCLFLERHDQLLAVADGISDIEEQNVEPSAEHEWPELPENAPQNPTSANGLVDEFAGRIGADRLFLPFTPDGRALLLNVLADRRLPPLSFAFGTNADVIARLGQSGIDLDILSYFMTDAVAFKRRETARIVETVKPEPAVEPMAVREMADETRPDRKVISPSRHLLTSLLRRLLRRQR